jgi:hypothetical protein
MMPRNAINIQITGLREAVNALQGTGPRMNAITAKLLKTFADTQVVTPAKQRYVPVATGNLRSTIHTEPPVISDHGVVVTVAAGGPSAKYASKVHENPRAGRTGGVSPQGKPYRKTKGGKPTWSTIGGWKYLEIPAMLAARGSATWLLREANTLMQVFRGRR